MQGAKQHTQYDKCFLVTHLMDGSNPSDIPTLSTTALTAFMSQQTISTQFHFMLQRGLMTAVKQNKKGFGKASKGQVRQLNDIAEIQATNSTKCSKKVDIL